MYRRAICGEQVRYFDIKRGTVDACHQASRLLDQHDSRSHVPGLETRGPIAIDSPGRNKLVAGIASKLNKPRGFTLVEPGGEAAFLAGLKIGKLPGIGAKTEAAFNRKGIFLIADLFSKNESELALLLGRDWREFLCRARGIDDSPVESEHEDAKSYSMQETFGEDINDRAEIEREIKRMIDELIPKIRTDKKRVRTMTLKVRYPGMENSTAGHSIAEASDLETSFYPHVANLLRAAWKQRRPLRLVSVRFSSVEEPDGQLQIFGGDLERQRRLATALWIDGAAVDVAHSEVVAARAHELRALGFGVLDGLHLAYAEAAGARWLVTCDDRLTELARRHATRLRVGVVNPCDLQGEWKS